MKWNKGVPPAFVSELCRLKSGAVHEGYYTITNKWFVRGLPATDEVVLWAYMPKCVLCSECKYGSKVSYVYYCSRDQQCHEPDHTCDNAEEKEDEQHCDNKP